MICKRCDKVFLNFDFNYNTHNQNEQEAQVRRILQEIRGGGRSSTQGDEACWKAATESQQHTF